MDKEVDGELELTKKRFCELKKQIGTKYDHGKLDYSLIPVDAYEGMAKVFTYGAGKYGIDNWQHVTPARRYLSAAVRHIQEFRKGNDNDEESGLMHLDHAITSLIMYRELTKNVQKTT